MIFGEENHDDFPPLRSGSRDQSGVASSQSGEPSPSLHGDSRVPPMAAGSSSAGGGPSGSRATPAFEVSDSAPATSVPCSSGFEGSSARASPSWSSLFSSEVKLQFTAPKMVDGKKSVVISKYVLDKGITLWDDFLVGQFFGVFPKLAVI